MLLSFEMLKKVNSGLHFMSELKENAFTTVEIGLERKLLVV